VTDRFYTSLEWKLARERALARDGRRCSVARLLGGDCSATLHVHHLKPRKEHPELELDVDNLITTCSRHHPTLEAVRRLLLVVRLDVVPPCPHRHVYAAGREECERRRRQRALARRERQLVGV
jgi:hypothetical protein